MSLLRSNMSLSRVKLKTPVQPSVINLTYRVDFFSDELEDKLKDKILNIIDDSIRSDWQFPSLQQFH